MIFRETGLEGAYIIEPERSEDGRGWFARTWCQREMGEHGLSTRLVQCGMSFNKTRGTLRGMHFQLPPHGETKVIRCTRGSIYDVIIDLRPDSATYKAHIGVRLSAENLKMLYVPEGCAHGFQTLEDSTEVSYQMSEFYHAESASGVRWDDPAFAIDWPHAPSRVMSERDRNWPDFIAGRSS